MLYILNLDLQNKMKSNTVTLIRKNTSLLIQNPTTHILRYLKYTKRSIDVRHGIVQTEELLYRTLKDNSIVTMQGFYRKCIELCKKFKVPYEVVDKRLPFPIPRIEKIKGLRGTQFSVLTQFLTKNESGIIKVPTRFGKAYLMLNVLRAFPQLPTVVAMPGVDLVNQFYKKVKEMLPERDVAKIVTGSRANQSNDITICSLDSMEKLDKKNVKLVIVDEIHAAVSDSRASIFTEFENARFMGFTATASGRFDGGDKLIIGLFGAVLVEKTFKEAVAEGMICPITVYMVRTKLDNTTYKNYKRIYNDVFYHNARIQDLVARITNTCIPKGFQTLTVIDNKVQAYALSQVMDDAEVAIAGDMNTSTRRDMFDKMQNNEVLRCIATGIYSQGVTFSNLRCMINYAGGSKNISSVQKPGRLAEIVEGKKCGYLIDFLLENDDEYERELLTYPVVRDSRNRMELYEETGYDVIVVDESEIETMEFT